MDVEQILSVSEETCPDCGGHLRMTSAGGTAAALEEYESAYSPLVPTVWAVGGPEILGMEYLCPDCGRKFYIAITAAGDWAC